jgi:DNA-binding NarL/FixJ family response regulator
MKLRGAPGLRILLVDDYEPFRRYLAVTLQHEADFQILGQASDGLEALQKAEQLQPDLILLDVGLPRLNGLETARRLRRLAPLTKILFISQEFSFDLVEAAFRVGALGYMHKIRAQSELLPAIEAILSGRYFVSGVVKGGIVETTGDKQSVRHEVHFCSDDAIVLKSFTDFISTTLRADKAAIMIATASHRDGVLQALQAQSVDVDYATKAGALILVDDSERLSMFMRDDKPDPSRFFDAVGDLVEAAANAATKKQAPRVAVCRECSPVLFANGRMVEALRLEQLWRVVAHTRTLDILCAYSLTGFEKHQDTFESICAEHSAVHSR